MRDAVQYEKVMNEFFMSVKAAIMADDKRLKKWSDNEKEWFLCTFLLKNIVQLVRNDVINLILMIMMS